MAPIKKREREREREREKYSYTHSYPRRQMEEKEERQTPVLFTPGNKFLYQLNRRLGGPHSRSEFFRHEENLSLQPGLPGQSNP
jgi:hypothetical protein